LFPGLYEEVIRIGLIANFKAMTQPNHVAHGSVKGIQESNPVTWGFGFHV
jgi:hypothetical protein